MFLTLLIAFFSLIALMIIHEFGHFIIAKKFGVRVEEFGIGYPPRLFGKQFGGTFYSVNLIPLGAFVKIYGEEGDVHSAESFTFLPIWKRMLIVAGGVIAFWLSAIVIFSVLFSIGASVPVGDKDVPGSLVKVLIMNVADNSPAQKSGLRKGDVILSIKNQIANLKVDKIEDFQEFLRNDNGLPVILNVERQGKNIELNLIPRIDYSQNQGAIGAGLERMAQIIDKYPFYQAPWEGLKFTFEVTVKSLQGIYEAIVNLVSGKGAPSTAQLAGPVGITIFLANAVGYGLGFFLYFIGSISVLVAIFNIFPIPALDGGKLVFLLIEKVIGKPVPVKWEQVITAICFILLISMSLFITIKFDIPRVVDYWKAGI